MRRTAVAALAVAFLASGLTFTHTVIPAPAQAVVTPVIVDSPMGEVNGIATSAQGTTYAVGSFTGAGASTGGLAKLATDDSELDRSFPPVLGKVEAIVPDATGGYYIGGSFTVVGGKPRAGLARVLSDGSVDDSWAPSISSNTSVTAIALRDDTVYIGGSFTSVNGTSRPRLAAINSTTGALSGWNPSPNFGVTALAMDDSALYVAGSFTQISSTARDKLAAFDITTAELLTWNPGALSVAGVVYSLKSTGALVYVGGSFTTIGGSARNNLAAVNAVATGNSNVSGWTPIIASTVNAIDLDDTNVYAVGSFSTAGSPSQTRKFAAAFARSDGSLNANWNPNLGNWGLSVKVVSDGVWIGGYFTTVNGTTPRSRLTKVDKATGAATSFEASLASSTGGAVKAIALPASGSSVLVGGEFTHAKVQTRANGAAFDSNGRLTSWAPNISNTPNDIAVVANKAYVVGSFTSVNGSIRNRSAAISLDDTGSTLSWNPNFNGDILDIELADDTAYVVGSFTRGQGGGVPRNYAASVQLDTFGTVTDWNPNLNQSANKVTLTGGNAYIGGNFTQVNGSTTRNRAAAFRTDDTGTVLGWNPNVNASVWDIQLANGAAYLAGEFTSVNGSTSRSRFAAVALDDTATATSWSPSVLCESSITSRCNSETNAGYAIAVSGPIAYLGGRFTTVSGTRGLVGLAAVSTDDTGSTVSSWLPALPYSSGVIPVIRKISLMSGSLRAAGKFDAISLANAPYPANLATLPAAATAPAAPTGVAATAGDASASVSWTPGSNGGATVTRVEFALDDTTTVDDSSTNTTSPYALTGLTNGQTYTVYVRLVNSAGTGAWSTASAPFTPTAPAPPPPPPVPMTAPGAPTAVSAQAGNASATITWAAPADSGSFAVSGYSVTASPGGHACTSATTTCTVTGLTNGTTYTFTVVASSAAGSGPSSAPSNPVTPHTVPGAPVNVTAAAGAGSAAIRWSPPTDDGGAPITGYRVSTSPADAGCVTDGALECTLTGLTPGTEYAVTVAAVNAAGESAPSAPTTVTPRGEPSIVITGSRDGARIAVTGTVNDSDITKVRPRYRLDGQKRFRTADVAPSVVHGKFTWGRITSRSIAVYVVAQGLISNRIVIRGD